MTTRTITLSAEQWQTIKIALQRSSWRLDLCEDDLYVSPDLSAAYDALDAALAQPEPVGPTDDELDIAVIAIQRLAPYQPDGPTQPTHDIYAVERGREILKLHLAQWGRPAIEPVPVAERLPGVKDCDIKGRCWFIDDDEKWCPVILGDILDEDEPDAIQRIICYYGYTHWVQGWALPVPSSPTNE